MRIFNRENNLRKHLAYFKKEGNSIGFVPTMGAFHDGHLSLIRRARRFNDIVIVSIFINPIQFAAGENYKEYPRDLKRDLELASQEGVDIVYCPLTSEIYPTDFCTYVTVNGLEDVLCAKMRPGHFKGVATVCAKLFNIVSPDVAYFGQKDAQQTVIVKKMIQDLNMPYKIKVLPTVREKDGLAMSSRNSYLSDSERGKASIIYEALKRRRKCFQKANVMLLK